MFHHSLVSSPAVSSNYRCFSLLEMVKQLIYTYCYRLKLCHWQELSAALKKNFLETLQTLPVCLIVPWFFFIQTVAWGWIKHCLCVPLGEMVEQNKCQYFPSNPSPQSTLMPFIAFTMTPLWGYTTLVLTKTTAYGTKSFVPWALTPFYVALLPLWIEEISENDWLCPSHLSCTDSPGGRMDDFCI